MTDYQKTDSEKNLILASPNKDYTLNSNPLSGVYLKAERIVSAVFLVTNNISEDDLLKTKIKDLSLNLLTYLNNLIKSDFTDLYKSVINIESISTEIISMFRIASVSGKISEMNSEIIINELNIFVSELKKVYPNIVVKENDSIKNILNNSIDANKLNQNSNTNNLVNKSLNQNSRVKENLAPSTLSYKSENNNQTNNLGGRKATRKSIILSFISRNGSVSIKDILPHVKGCSEKTIQRELIELINEGKITKTGERRWSKYNVL